MAEASLVYKVDDRSILLPIYRRVFVTPLLPLLPAKLSPNAITHAGHVFNLLGVAVLVATWPERGWPFAIAALGLQLYNWCDNADGAHARRTAQTSALGEFLDHGLDTLNVTYIAWMSAIGIGAPPLWWIALASVLPAAGAVIYWEQAETGTFHLGRLNQVESVLTLTGILLASATFGRDVFERVELHGVTLRVGIMVFAITTATIGMLHGVWRVWRAKGTARVLPIVPFFLFGGASLAAAALGAISTVAAVILVTASNVFFGLRMLAVRLDGRRPRFELGLAMASVGLLAAVVWKAIGWPVGVFTDTSLCAAAGGFLAILALVNARAGVRRVSMIDRAR